VPPFSAPGYQAGNPAAYPNGGVNGASPYNNPALNAQNAYRNGLLPTNKAASADAAFAAANQSVKRNNAASAAALAGMKAKQNSAAFSAISRQGRGSAAALNAFNVAKVRAATHR
jgi:hypothetical protein